MSNGLYQDLILTVDLPEHGLCAGDVGTLKFRDPLRLLIAGGKCG